LPEKLILQIYTFRQKGKKKANFFAPKASIFTFYTKMKIIFKIARFYFLISNDLEKIRKPICFQYNKKVKPQNNAFI
jgi:hypothetical protein